MPESAGSSGLRVLLDENVPLPVVRWLRNRQPHWEISHVPELGLRGCSDAAVFEWAQDNGCAIVTYDREFGPPSNFEGRQHHGIIRLRVWPTTVEETTHALSRLFGQMNQSELEDSLVIVGQNSIRVRPGNQVC